MLCSQALLAMTAEWEAKLAATETAHVAALAASKAEHDRQLLVQDARVRALSTGAGWVAAGAGVDGSAGLAGAAAAAWAQTERAAVLRFGGLLKAHKAVFGGSFTLVVGAGAGPAPLPFSLHHRLSCLHLSYRCPPPLFIIFRSPSPF